MTYVFRNKVTGAVIRVPCALGGSDWEEVQEHAAKPTEAVKKPTEAKKPAARKKVAKEG